MRITLPAVSVAMVIATPALAQTPDSSWVARSALYEVFVRDFSPAGNLRGVIDGLDRIQSSGADVIWLMPVQPVGIENRKGPLGSPYAIRDYRAIDSAFGTGEDFKALVRAAHERGMKVILDWVPDHTAWDHAWVSQHPEYYVKNQRGELSVPIDPDGKVTDWTDVVQLDYKNPEVRRVMTETMRYWLDEYGLDGFRVDIAGFLPYDFWSDAIPTLRSAVPRRLLFLAEWGDPELNRRGFDLIYAWDSYKRLKAVFRGAPASTYVDSELVGMRGMPPGGMKLRFTTNHDETSWDKPPITLFGSPASARAAFVATAFLPGRPLLYNGQEVESPQVLNLFVREAVAWDHPGAAEARAFYARVLHLARTEPALIAGDFAGIATNAPDDVIAYRRGGLVVLVNARPREARVTVTGIEVNGAQDLLSSPSRTQRGNRVTLPAYGAMVLRWAGQ